MSTITQDDYDRLERQLYASHVRLAAAEVVIAAARVLAVTPPGLAVTNAGARQLVNPIAIAKLGEALAAYDRGTYGETVRSAGKEPI